MSERKIVDYILANINYINEYFEKGYTLYASPFQDLDGETFWQAMVKYED